MASLKPTMQQQNDMALYVSRNYDNYVQLTQDWRTRMLEIYREYGTFVERRRAARQSTFKVNKAHEIVNKITPRIVARDPKWLVSVKVDTVQGNMLLDEQQRAEEYNKLSTYAAAMRDYLTSIFKKHNLIEPLRLWAKNMIIYGNSYAEVAYIYNIGRTVVDKTEDVTDENGMVTKVKSKEIKEYVYGEHPTINIKSFSDMYFDPRYGRWEDMPWYIKRQEWVRLADLKRSKNYINLDKIEAMCGVEYQPNDIDNYRQKIFNVTGIMYPDAETAVDKNSLKVMTWEWLYTMPDVDWNEKSSEDEKLYRITVVNRCVVICAEEIPQKSVELIRCFEDTETNLSRGFVEPMMGLQRELNFKKNSASEFINAPLNRQWFWNPNSGVNPRDMVSKPGGIIPTSKTKEQVDNNMWELPRRNISPDYFNEGNDFERQIQAVTFTVDTSNPDNQQALTNTATGARIKFYESNVVIDDVRKRWEAGVAKLWYMLLMATLDNMDGNIVFEKDWTDEFWEVNKEAFRNALERYNISVEPGSSSYDTIENRRDDALAKRNLGLEWAKAGVPVNLQNLLTDVYEQFEDADPQRFIIINHKMYCNRLDKIYLLESRQYKRLLIMLLIWHNKSQDDL